jgi:hypothetical protein
MSSRDCRQEYTLNVIAEGFTVYENDNADIADQP